MGGSHIDALRISPHFTSNDWCILDCQSKNDWTKAADIVKDRLVGRFLQFASTCLQLEHSGFVVLAIDSLLAETIQQFKDGVTNGNKQSEKMVTRFLEGSRFQSDFDATARIAFYRDIRCGLLHQAEAKEMWLIRRKQPAMLQEVTGGRGYIIDVDRFHTGVQDSLNDYLKLLLEPTQPSLRSNLWKKMDHICKIRTARGALVEADAAPPFME